MLRGLGCSVAPRIWHGSASGGAQGFGAGVGSRGLAPAARLSPWMHGSFRDWVLRLSKVNARSN
jgi:hypothetical protein